MTRASAALAAASSILCAAAAIAAEAPADLVLRGGVVHTADARRPRAEAVAVRDGRIVAVGGDADVALLVGPRTRVLDLAGRTVVPGFDDAHAHLLGIGFARLDVDLAGTRSFDEVVARVAAALKGRPPGEWVRGRGWHEGKWDAPARGAVRGFPTHQALSAVSPANPVVLERADGHASLANARAMALRGVSRATRAPEGGEVIRDDGGEPTGVFVDNAQSLVEPPARTRDEVARALDLAMDECLAKGVTSLTDAGAPLEVIDLYRRTAAAGRLRVRLNVMAGGLAVMKRARPAGDGRRRRHAHGARGEALRRRRPRLAGSRAPRALRRRPRQPRACSSRRPRRSSRPRASRSLTASRSARTRSATGRTGSCSTPTRRRSPSTRR